MLYHLYYFLAPYPHMLLATLSGCAALGLFWIARRSSPALPHDRVVLRMLAAGGAVLAVHLGVTHWLPLTAILQLQISRVTLFFSLFATLYFAHSLSTAWRGALSQAPPGAQGKPGGLSCGRKRRVSSGPGGGLLLAGVFFATSSAIFPLLVWAVCRLRKFCLSGFLSLCLILGLLGANMAAGMALGVWAPGIHLFAPRDPWIATQAWARDHTPREAVFIAPPYQWGPYVSDWRVYSERTAVATLSEILEIALSPGYLETWVPRFQALAPGALDQFNGNYVASFALTRTIFNGLSKEDFTVVACRYGADYLVIEKPESRAFPIVYQNEGFTIFDLRPARSSACP
jgi:hypothetical protein